MLAGVQPYSAAISVTFLRSTLTNCKILACSAALIRAMGDPRNPSSERRFGRNVSGTPIRVYVADDGHEHNACAEF